ncbi:putative ternary complex factor MIP1, leucine-zipper [Rosa chinensis]|uniref:Putative ternary complex factor MIP1, leucine-zipper n=1 Tax=Rosa chinensis TaxID=74649 RepID=A0A2P6S7E7_ROSCH|nr:putative ternary complex factor MIP1, leucine-zipper [Rosa chinensis]
MMCDSPIVQTKLSQSDSLCKYSHSSISCDSEFQSEVVKDDSLSKVQRLERQLLEEIELRAILENAIEKNATQFSSPACLPYNAQEILSIIAAVEVTVSELEQDRSWLHCISNQVKKEIKEGWQNIV